jgi:diadenosine tetraphosphate (Ap4A) HIT family hydrolase
MVEADTECVICARLRDGQPHEGSVGGYCYEDEHWCAYHAPVHSATLGQLFLIAKRHFLDFAEMTPAEAASFGLVLHALYAALKHVVGAERVYAHVSLEGVAHFHVWLIPRAADAERRGWAFITSERSCQEDDARAVVDDLRAALRELAQTASGSDTFTLPSRQSIPELG